MELWRETSVAITAAAIAIVTTAVGCGGTPEGSGETGGSTSTGGSGGSTATAGSGGSGGSGGTTTSTGGGGSSGGPVCDPPIQAADVSQPTTVVGTGPGTCTEAAFAAAIEKGGVITFDCGGAATIPITSQKELRKDKDTTIDGGGEITLDGGEATRIFHFDGGDFRKTTTVVTLQHLTITRAKSTGTKIPDAPPPCSQGTDVDGGGAAILIRDGVLHVIDVVFTNGQAAPLGPDVAGGAVYGIGSLDVTIMGSTFVSNTASNGGAVGSLFSNLTLVYDTFESNEALGEGANYIDPACGVNGGESGNGGNGGAVVIDGGESFDVAICGCMFTENHGGALGGAVFRTPDLGVAPTHVDLCTFQGNQAKGGGAAYFHHSDLTITGSTFSDNSAEGAGAIQADDTDLQMTNVTFAGNSATAGLGGAIAMFGNGGKMLNVTFANNHADGGSGLFGAAIAGGTTFEIDNSLFANNTSQDCGAPMTCHAGQSQGTSDIQWPEKHLVCDNPDPPCGGAAGTTFADPVLGELFHNGGPTKTMAPAANGPAASAGTNCPPTDQRGHPRNAGSCTVGAYELP